jgi:hypothetical protein
VVSSSALFSLAELCEPKEDEEVEPNEKPLLPVVSPVSLLAPAGADPNPNPTGFPRLPLGEVLVVPKPANISGFLGVVDPESPNVKPLEVPNPVLEDGAAPKVKGLDPAALLPTGGVLKNDGVGAAAAGLVLDPEPNMENPDPPDVGTSSDFFSSSFGPSGLEVPNRDVLAPPKELLLADGAPKPENPAKGLDGLGAGSTGEVDANGADGSVEGFGGANEGNESDEGFEESGGGNAVLEGAENPANAAGGFGIEREGTAAGAILDEAANKEEEGCDGVAAGAVAAEDDEGAEELVLF